MTYWQDRMQKAQHTLMNKSVNELNKHIRAYYIKLSTYVISEYEALYDKLQTQAEVSPATLYSLDKYWSMNAQLQKKLSETNAQFGVLLSKAFQKLYKSSYSNINIQGLDAFNTLDDAAIMQVINSVWCADGKTWSDRVWNNLALLQRTLDENLIQCVVAGKKTSDLKQLLQDTFNVSYNRADTLVRTEVAHIQTEAAKQRYIDYGITKVEFWADPDERTCDECGKLHSTVYSINAAPKVPIHPNCRCSILPVIETK